MYPEQITFILFTITFILLSTYKTIRLYKQTNQEQKNDDILKKYSVERTKMIEEKLKSRFKYFKMVLNSNFAGNSSFLIVGLLSESYFYGVRLFINIVAIGFGYFIASFVIIPLMITLDNDIKTPYQYFERRYGKKKYVRVITASVGMVFYFSFLSLYLYGSSILLSTLIPNIPILFASMILGVISIGGSNIGGFTQATKTNGVQFFVVLIGLISAASLTLYKFTKSMSLADLYNFAHLNNRTEVFNQKLDFVTRYTGLGQLVSLMWPWAAFHSLFLPNFLRYRSVKGTMLKKRLTAIANFPSIAVVNLIGIISGGFICYLYFYGCDLFLDKKIANKNQTGPIWLHSIFRLYGIDSFTGVMFSCIVCFSMVQHSLGMNLCAKTICNEILKPLFNTNQQFEKILKTILINLLGLGSIAYAISFQFLKNTILSLFFIFNNSINSPTTGLYLLSAFNPYANHVGAMSAFVLNLSINFWWVLGHVNLISNTRSQEFKQTTALCHANFNFTNLTQASILVKEIIATTNLTLSKKEEYFPKNEIVYFFYAMGPIWYGLWSVLFTFFIGSGFSFIYSLFNLKPSNSDSDQKDETKNYLFCRSFKKVSN